MILIFVFIYFLVLWIIILIGSYCCDHNYEKAELICAKIVYYLTLTLWKHPSL